VQLVENVMTDARTKGRWYLVVTMGRKAGHLALAIGKAAGTTLTLIPDEFDGAARTDSPRIALDHLCDIIIGAIVNECRRSRGRNRRPGRRTHRTPPGSGVEQFGPLERDEYGTCGCPR
jgi:ATP-dependent phosphofructokinase / diphosphate-dependent phosphofructokinase